MQTCIQTDTYISNMLQRKNGAQPHRYAKRECDVIPAKLVCEFSVGNTLRAVCTLTPDFKLIAPCTRASIRLNG